MPERRRLPRKSADQIIEVHDLNSDRRLGRVVNLTSEGMMLASSEPIESNLVFQLELRLDGRGTTRPLRLQCGAESLWCSSASTPDHYWTGFRIIDISLETVDIIEALVEDWRTDERGLQ